MYLNHGEGRGTHGLPVIIESDALLHLDIKQGVRRRIDLVVLKTMHKLRRHTYVNSPPTPQHRPFRVAFILRGLDPKVTSDARKILVGYIEDRRGKFGRSDGIGFVDRIDEILTFKKLQGVIAGALKWQHDPLRFLNNRRVRGELVNVVVDSHGVVVAINQRRDATLCGHGELSAIDCGALGHPLD